jgi:integrase
MTKIYHIHIRKTAGTVIHELLRKQFQEQQVCPIRSEIELRGKFLIDERLTTIRQYPLISGHFYSFGKRLMPAYKIVTFLRDPVARTISAFNHIQYSKRDPFHKKLTGLTIGEALQSNLADLELRNGQTRFLVGNAGYDYNNLDDDAISIAKSFIDQLFFVGIQELMELSVQRLTFLLGVDPPHQIDRINTKVTASGIKVNDLSADELKLVQKYNAYDLQVYQYAREKFELTPDQQ